MTNAAVIPETDEPTRDAMLADMARAWESATTPAPLRERFETFARDNASHVERLLAALYASAAWWIIKGAEAGHDRDVLDQVALQQLHRVAAGLCLTMKARQGEPYDPARLAVVAYLVARHVGEHGKPADLVGVTELQNEMEAESQTAIEADNVALRARITEILDAAHEGNATDADRLVAIRDLCSAEIQRWFDGPEAGPGQEVLDV